MIRREVAAHYTIYHYRQHDRTHRDMEAMEASQHEEGRSIDTRAEFEIEFGIGMHVFECLETHKHCTKLNGRKQPESSLRAMASAQCMVRDRQGHARSQL